MNSRARLLFLIPALLYLPACAHPDYDCPPDEDLDIERRRAEEDGIDVVTAEEVEVYLAWMVGKYGRANRPVVSARTLQQASSLMREDVMQDLPARLEGLRTGTIEEFRREAGREGVMAALPGKASKWCLISEGRKAELFGEGGGWWSGFYDLYGDVPGLLTFSRVGFDPKRNQALLFVDLGRGGRAGSGRFVLMEQSGRREWKIVSEYVALAY